MALNYSKVRYWGRVYKGSMEPSFLQQSPYSQHRKMSINLISNVQVKPAQPLKDKILRGCLTRGMRKIVTYEPILTPPGKYFFFIYFSFQK